jgi:predicted TPR repeat methyltransferase
MNSTKRIQRAKISVAELKKRRYENYLKLKKNLKMTKNLNQIPERKKQMRATFLVTLFQVHYMEQFHQFLQCKQLKYGVPVQIRQLLREEKINSQDAKMTLFLQQGWINLQGNIKWVDVPIVFNP